MSAYIPMRLRQEVRERDHNCCAYCQSCEFLMGVTYEIDHVIPLSYDGTTTVGNLCLSCPMCNRYKANHITYQDPITQQDVELFHPRQQIWDDHFMWNDSYTEIVGLTPTGRATIACLHVNRPMLIQLRGYWVALELHPPH